MIKKLERLETYGIDWFDEDIPVGPEKKILDEIKELIPDFVHNNLIPFRIVPSIEEGVCLSFKKDNIIVYVEFYNDGDIGLIAEDYVKKCIIKNINLTKENVIPEVKSILKGE
jgi:hypothetical protein